MKKKIFLAFIIFLISVLSCSVGDYSGLIRITNRTKDNLTNVKLGSTVIALLVTPGNYADYWYISEISGALTSDNTSVRFAQVNSKFILKPGYWVDIISSTAYNGSNELYIQAEKVGGTLSPSDWIK
jgi:hypothetical protein